MQAVPSKQMVLQAVTKHAITLVSDLAGCPQNFLADECVPYAVAGGAVEHCAADAHRPATLVPKDALVLSFVVDKQGNTFVWMDGLFAARAEYSMEHVVGCDSIVYGFAYHGKDMHVPVVRLFDACRLQGRCMLSKNCFERFEQLFASMSASSRSRASTVRMHWVWTEGWLHEFVLCQPGEHVHGMDCEWERAIRLPDLLTPEASYSTITTDQ
jgi:hypothetical protein